MSSSPKEPSIKIHSPSHEDAEDESLKALKRGFGHRSPFDAPLINAAAQGIFEAGRNAESILEVCCGYGDLLAGLAETFPDAQVTGMDQFPGTVEIAGKAIEGKSNARVLAHDVMKLDDWADESVDLVIGQATLHHLTHNPQAAIGEFHRVLKPGGKCMFTFEPLSHNHTVNAVRSYRNAAQLLIDESNLYLDTINRLASEFSTLEIQCFNLTCSYLLKALPSWSICLGIGRLFRELDSLRFRISSKALRKAANMNIILTK